MNPEQLAKTSLATGVSLFGLTLAEVSTIVTIIAGLAATFASVAAGIYYIHKGRKGD
jgi:hypothetical protein